MRQGHCNVITQKINMGSKTLTQKGIVSTTSPPIDIPKRVYAFGERSDGDASMRDLLGGKGANLAEMARIGLPVPPGFTITTEVCIYYYKNNETYPENLGATVRSALAGVEEQIGKKFGNPEDPLLFSVRSGARDSMPGMMDTILNLGLNDITVEGLARQTANPRFAYDCYRRFIQMYGDVVMGVQPRDESEHEPFDAILQEFKTERGLRNDNDLTSEDLQELIARFQKLIIDRTGSNFPQDSDEQLWGAIGAVFGSWNNERAMVYRQRYNIPSDWGTAVNVQAMVYGNMGDNCATGVAFTRNPATGKKEFYGEYLINAQGEDVVAGVRTPKPITKLAEEMPKVHHALEEIRHVLENHFKDMQDFEFTVQEDKLYMLQTRNGKRTGLAAVRIAVEMVREKLMKVTSALNKVPAESIASLLVPIFDEESRKSAKRIASGLPAGPGAASGKIVFSAHEATRLASRGEHVVLCRIETSPEDLRGMIAAQGILTSRGGVSSHAALVARQMGKVCVCGAQEIFMDYSTRLMKVDHHILREGDHISIDGTTGEVFSSYVETAPSEVSQVLNGQLAPGKSYTFQLFDQVMRWADRYRKLRVRTNADTPKQSRQAVALGAEGIGLCRTEHMFFEADRIVFMRQMILATDEAERRAALRKLLPFQKKDFVRIFRAMGHRPVTIRLLDPPLHEFLPQDVSARNALAESLGIPTEIVAERIKALHEQNPMLGHRGCRLGISYPEITEMQSRAIFEAAAYLVKEGEKKRVTPEVMVPLVGFAGELTNQIEIIRRIADEVMTREEVKIEYLVGTMIEIPRAAIRAEEIAKTAEFFSFGTNDLTQTTLGMSRDDSGSFLVGYQDLEITSNNPFSSIDQTGVGELVKMAIDKGRKTRGELKLGICGEHGGDPDSVRFFHHIGLDYVSCSPPRIPVARLAAAQAALESACS